MKKIKLQPRSVFLVDGIGALISALLLVILLAPFEPFFGMPQEIVYTLSVPAFMFAGYSLGCYFIKIKKWKPWLITIAIANFLYCMVTCGLMVQQYHSLTIAGLGYFIGEIIVILFIIRIELMIIRKHSAE